MEYAVFGTGKGTHTNPANRRRSLDLTRGTVLSKTTAAIAVIVLCMTTLGCWPVMAQEPEGPALSDSDVERLRGLLLRHQNGGDNAPTAEALPRDPRDLLPIDASAGESQLASALSAPYSPEKLLLRADEWPLLREEVEARLSDTAIAERRSNSPLIGTIQIRRQGSLVGSSTYNFRHIGKHQFVGQTKLGDGLNILGVSDFEWEIELPPLDGNPSHLLLLTAPPRQDWVLHLIPASILADTQSDRPLWLRAPLAETSAAP